MTPLTMDEIKNQIKKACQIYKNYPRPLPQRPHSCLSIYGIRRTPVLKEIFYPTPKEIDMADTVQFVWLQWLNPDERRILWQRFDGTPLKILAYREDLSIRQIRYKIQKSLEKIFSNLSKNRKEKQ